MSAKSRAILRRLSILAAAMLALFALYRMEGRATGIAIWTALMVLSSILPYRIPNTALAVWLLRVPLVALAILLNLSNSIDVINVYDAKTMAWLGELGAAEMVRAAWTQESEDSGALRPLWLSGIVMLASSCTEDTIMAIITPAYFLALLVGIRIGAPTVGQQRTKQFSVPWRFGFAVACALLAGAGLSAFITYEKTAITAWGMSMLGERRMPENGSLSLNPTLTSTFGQRGSLARVMRIEGSGDFAHLRGVAFTTYSGGSWGPRLTDMQEEPISTEIESVHPGHMVRVTRLLNNRGIIFAPLNANGLHFDEGTPLGRVKARGDLIRISWSAPTQYQIDPSEDVNHQGLLCRKPTNDEMIRLLAVPKDIDPLVHKLCSEITSGITDPRMRIEAIERYLTSNHQYSLQVDIGKGDPISTFLLQKKNAHCEFFAAAAVILSRIAGVPARYVIGYLAHETETNGTTIVRQRDAHAWAECWLEGTGWVTLDATPGDGRPDSLTETPSSFERIGERLQDWITALRLGLHRDTIIKTLVAAISVFLIVMAIRGLRTLLLNTRQRDRDYTYTDPSAELATLFRQYERACRRYGLICPPGRTWLEYLAERETVVLESELSRQLLDAALLFMHAYNRARFGDDLPARSIVPLRSLLADIRQSPTRITPEMSELRRK